LVGGLTFIFVRQPRCVVISQMEARRASKRIATVRGHFHVGVASETCVHPLAGSSQGQLLKGEVAIITGSGQGIGEATAYLFAENGAKVVVTDLDREKSEKVAANIRALGGEAISVPGDVTDPTFPDHLVKETIKSFGAIDILVNNAGYTWDGVIHRMSDKQWEAMLAVHNTAPFRLIRAAAPYMRELAKEEMEKTGKTKQRNIINISSTSGLHGNAGQINYATAKMGVVGMTKTIAKEWGMFNIRCNAVAFGWINTRLTQSKDGSNFIQVDKQKVALGVPNRGPAATEGVPLKRAGTVEDAAGAVLLLASPYASYITGHTLEVTGGVGI